MKARAVQLLLVSVLAVGARSSSNFATEMVEGARQLIISFTAEQRTDAVFTIGDEERFNWHYIPRTRKGVPFKTMTEEQNQQARQLLRLALSEEGYRKAEDIFYLDQVLYEQTRRSIRNPELYYFTFFGVPSDRAAWGWRIEGHHLSLNFTLEKGRLVSLTPFFYGANPAEVPPGHEHMGLRTLAAEEDLGRALFKMFTGDQRGRVLVDVRAPRDIITEASRRAEVGPAAGLSYAEMSADQRQRLVELLEVYSGRLRPEIAEAEMTKIRTAGLEKIYFSWAGGSEPGQPHYYRLHGPGFVIEYDNTQDNANHIHTVWRSFADDFGLDSLAGRDLLREHYATAPHHAHERPQPAD